MFTKLSPKMTFVAFTLVTLVFDQLSKIWAAAVLTPWQMTSYLNDLFRIGYTENHGAFLSLGGAMSESMRTMVFIGVVGAFLTGISIYVLRDKKLTNKMAMAWALIVSGGTSNWLDRVLNDGGVIDFLNLGIGSLRTGVFNIADMFILAGAAMLLFWGWQEERALKSAT
ncbi:signal peptidase II [Pseudoalteromonas phenolica]|uniref:signal peptidase II n=1 Tax=Pseudoalteromonas phenolica TaxID=161398 RepID=UPI00384F95C0